MYVQKIILEQSSWRGIHFEWKGLERESVKKTQEPSLKGLVLQKLKFSFFISKMSEPWENSPRYTATYECK